MTTKSARLACRTDSSPGENRDVKPVTGIDPAFPRSVKAQMERALDTELTSIVRQTSGTGGRSYLIRGEAGGNWIARIRDGSTPELRKSLVVQKRAASVGVRVPTIVAAQVELREPRDFTWIVEEYLRGYEFYPERMDPELRKPTSADIGRQLRLLHTVELNGFGYLTRNLQDAPHATWGGWLDQQEARVEDALRIAACRPPDIPVITNAYRTLRHTYVDSSRLCHGDFSDDNLLVEDGSVIGVIDWENARAGDPASDVAYWFMWHGDFECLDALLAGYAPADPSGFRRRVTAHRILYAVELICTFDERHDPGGVEHCRRILNGIAAYV
jgi:aminoglycoside phosphotransferase (APT) family kinase protein